MTIRSRYVFLTRIGLVGCCVAIFLYSCDSADRFAKMEIVNEISLENGEKKAVMYVLDYGATASSRLNVSILPSEAKIRAAKGVVYSALFTDHLDYDLLKIDEQTIKVVHEYRPQDPFVSYDEYEGIKIKY